MEILSAISRVRADALASSRFVRFAHATISTNATAPAAATSAGLASLTTSASSGDTDSRTGPVRYLAG